MLFSTLFFSLFFWKYLKIPLHLLVKWEVVSPNSRYGQWVSISNICILYSLVLICVCGGGGGGNIFLAFYAISNICRNKILGIKKNCPFTYWSNGRWFPQIVDRDSGNLYQIYIYIQNCGVSFWTCWREIFGYRVALFFFIHTVKWLIILGCEVHVTGLWSDPC